MAIYRDQINLKTNGQSTYEITRSVQVVINASGVKDGLVHIHCKHTSCSLVLMENADPSARRDLEAWIKRLVPENDPHFTHTYEGADDMPSHIKMALTRSQETLPIESGRLDLGTWQGLFLWEHRDAPHHRSLVITVWS